MKAIFSKKSLSLGALLSLGLLAACGESSVSGPDTHQSSVTVTNKGYYNETISSCSASKRLAKGGDAVACTSIGIEYIDVFKEAAVRGSVQDPQGNPLKNASVNLLKSGLKNLALGGGVGQDLDAFSDENGKFVTSGLAVYGLGSNGTLFLQDEHQTDTVPAGFYSYKVAVRSADGAYAAMVDVDMDTLAVELTDGAVYVDVGTLVAKPTYSLGVPTAGFKVGYTVCSDPLNVCHVIIEKDMENDQLMLNGLPAGDYNYCYSGELIGEFFTGCTVNPVHVGG